MTAPTTPIEEQLGAVLGEFSEANGLENISTEALLTAVTQLTALVKREVSKELKMLYMTAEASPNYYGRKYIQRYVKDRLSALQPNKESKK